MWPNPQETADLITFTEEILNGKLYFCAVKKCKIFIFRSECKLHMKLFPFDTQYCPMKFGSWAYDGGALDFREKRPYGDLSIFSPSGEFFIGGMYFLKSVRLWVL